MPETQTFTDVQPIQQSFTNVTPIGQAAVPPKSWTDSVGDFAGELWKQVNPVSGIVGLKNAVNHPIETYKNDVTAREGIYKQAEDAFKQGKYSEGAAHLIYSFVPFLGPAINEQGNNFVQGNYAKGAGGSIGIGLNLAGPQAVSKGIAAVKNAAAPAAQAVAERMYQSSLKPSVASYSTSEVKNMVRTGLENEIPVSAGGAAKLGDLVQDLNQKIRAQIAAGTSEGATVNKFKVASRLSDTAQKFETQVTPEADLQAVSDAGNEFLRNQPAEIPALRAQDLKAGTYKQLAGKYGELSSATKEAQKALARGIKEELQTQFPEIQGLNAQEGKLIGLDEALERAVRRIDNRNIMSLGGKIAAAGAGTVLGVESGHAIAGTVGGLVMHEVLTDPLLQSKLAIALNKTGKGASIATSRAKVAGYLNALGNAANSEQPSDLNNP